jgi:hypothetical protein
MMAIRRFVNTRQEYNLSEPSSVSFCFWRRDFPYRLVAFIPAINTRLAPTALVERKCSSLFSILRISRSRISIAKPITRPREKHPGFSIHSGDDTRLYQSFEDFITDALDITVAGTKVFLLHLALVKLTLGFGLGRCLLLVFALGWFLRRHDDGAGGVVLLLSWLVAALDINV